MRQMAIMGFPHSGTSILKRIIGNAPGVFEFPYETNAITAEIMAAAAAQSKTAVVVKDINFPWMESYFIPDDRPTIITEFKEFLTNHPNCRFVMVNKNPYDIFGSLNKRFGIPANAGDHPPGHSFREWETWAEVFTFFDVNPPTNLFTIRYEDFFTNGHARLRDLCGFLQMTFTDELLNSDRPSLIVENVSDVPAGEPTSRENGPSHGAFRTWQINQTFRDMTGESAKFLDQGTKTLIQSSKIVQRLYTLPA